jgi:drug/metabolite transporter (DMT)-like permease
MSRLEAQTLGVVLVLASAAFFALAGIFTKSVDSDLWTIICWRGFVGGALIAAYVWWRRQRQPSRPVLRLGWRGWLIALVSGLASIAFVAAFQLTYVANVAIIYSTVPFMAAAVGWLTIREGMRVRTFVSACLALVGVGIVVSGGLAAGSVLGDMVALVMTGLCALYLVMIRAFRETPVVWAAGVSALLLSAATLPLADLANVQPRDALLMSLFGISFASAIILWTEGTRLITAAESGFLGAAEMPLAILFAWLLLNEWPPAASILGGTIVIAAVLVHGSLDLRQGRLAAKARSSSCSDGNGGGASSSVRPW